MRLRSVTNLLVVGGLHVAFFAYGCGSSSSSSAGTDAGVTDTGVVETGGLINDPDCPATVDSTKPPAECGPNGIPVCGKNSQDDVSACANTSPCLAPVAQTGTVANLRMSTIDLYAPTVLQSAANIAVTPAITPACLVNSGGTAGTESFNWIMQIDTVANTIKTGGAVYAADHKTYSFLSGTVTGSAIATVCPGFNTGPAGTTISLAPVTATLTQTGGKYASAVVPLLNVPIYPTTTSTVPIVLPLSNAMIYDMELSTDHSCIGSFLEQYSCDGTTNGWKPGGGIVGHMLITDADRVPVQALGCESLCALLVGDAAVKGSDGYQHCPTDSMGNYPTTIGDSCVKGTGSCNDAITLTATFAAYGVTINN